MARGVEVISWADWVSRWSWAATQESAGPCQGCGRPAYTTAAEIGLTGVAPVHPNCA